MKKVFLGFLAILTFLLVALSSCSSKDNEENTDPEPPQKFENDILTVFLTIKLIFMVKLQLLVTATNF
ncbi:MAG: hypothetical protein IPL69_05475 [Saprospiraceae bacterium]|nr:hypothetical protein [Candidatus Brachybacter algidus]